MDKNVSDANRDIPIFMGHGQADPMVPYWVGEASRDHLVKLGYSVAWHGYPMPHSVVPEELMDIRNFIDQRIA